MDWANFLWSEIILLEASKIQTKSIMTNLQEAPQIILEYTWKFLSLSDLNESFLYILYLNKSLTELSNLVSVIMMT
jgi:hypothetical protein